MHASVACRYTLPLYLLERYGATHVWQEFGVFFLGGGSLHATAPNGAAVSSVCAFAWQESVNVPGRVIDWAGLSHSLLFLTAGERAVEPRSGRAT